MSINKSISILMIIALILPFASSLPAESLVRTGSIINVPGDYQYISWAVSNATDGDIILVDAWNYGGIEPYPIEINKSITIRGINGTVEIKSVPDVSVPVTTTFLSPRVVPLQLPNITIENIVFNITTPHTNITAFLMLDGAGTYEIILKNITLIGNRTVLPNLVYTIYLANSPLVSIINLADYMPASTHISSSNIVNLEDIYRNNAGQFMVDSCGALSIENYKSSNDYPNSLFIRFTPQIFLNNLTIENVTMPSTVERLIYIIAGTSDDYTIRINNITLTNITTNRFRSSLLYISRGTTLPSSVRIVIENYTVIQSPSPEKPIAFTVSMYNMNHNSSYYVSNIRLEGSFFWPFSLYNTYNTSITNVTIISPPGGTEYGAYVSNAKNITIRNIHLEETGLNIRDANNITIMNPFIKNGSLILEDSDVDIWYPEVSLSELIPFIEGDNSTFRAYSIKPSSVVEYNMSIGSDALNTTYDIYLIPYDEVPVKPPATVIVSPLFKINTSDSFNISITLKYNETILTERNIKEHLLDILKHNGTTWIKPTMLYMSKDLANNTISFVINNAGDPVIVLYSYPVVVGGEISSSSYTTDTLLPLAMILLITGLYILFRQTRYN